MIMISGLGSVDRSWESGASRRAAHEARMFAKVDSDGSGGVDAAELGSMLEHTGRSGDSTELLKEMDGDGDGSLNSDELSQGMRDLMPPPASTLDFAQSRGAAANDEDADAFAALDTDSDGQLSRDEFEAGRLQQQRAPQGAGGPPPAQAASGNGSTSATSSSDFDPLDTNQDGTVSAIERLAGELKELAKAGAGGSDGGQIAALAQKLYDQISRNNWLQADAQASVSPVDLEA